MPPASCLSPLRGYRTGPQDPGSPIETNDQLPIGLPFRTRLQASHFRLPFDSQLPLFVRGANSATTR
jgi:hypothetical protein